MEVYQYQNNGILKEFKGLSAVAIQEKCKNLEFSCQFLESDKDSFVVINAVNSISIFVADKENDYFTENEPSIFIWAPPISIRAPIKYFKNITP